MDRWTEYFLDLAFRTAQMSKDPNTQVGAVIVRDRRVLGVGYNGFPVGIVDQWERLHDRDLKLQLTIHAEVNAILNAHARVQNSTLYLVATDNSGAIWGGPPCIRCSMMVIQSGIKHIISPPIKQISKWKTELEQARCFLDEAGVTLNEVDYGR